MFSDLSTAEYVPFCLGPFRHDEFITESGILSYLILFCFILKLHIKAVKWIPFI